MYNVIIEITIGTEAARISV